MVGGQKATIIAQVGQIYSDGVGQYYTGDNTIRAKIIFCTSKDSIFIPTFCRHPHHASQRSECLRSNHPLQWATGGFPRF